MNNKILLRDSIFFKRKYNVDQFYREKIKCYNPDKIKEIKWHFEQDVVNFANEESASDASDWFFIIMPKSRMGSTVIQTILRTHKDIHCSSENYYPLVLSNILRSHAFVLMTQPFDTPIVLQNYNQPMASAQDIQDILKILKRRITNKKFLGFKQITWNDYVLKKVLPNAKYLMTIRNPLNACISEFNQEWCNYKPSSINYFDFVYKWLTQAINAMTFFKNEALLIRFEEMYNINYCMQIIRNAIQLIGADPEEFDYSVVEEKCLHKNTKSYWQNDVEAIQFMKQLKQYDPIMFQIIEENLYFIPEGKTIRDIED
jgi:hypothetical protein